MKGATVKTISRLAKAARAARYEQRCAQERIRDLVRRLELTQGELERERVRRDPAGVDTRRGRILALLGSLESLIDQHLVDTRMPFDPRALHHGVRLIVRNMRETLGSVEGGSGKLTVVEAERPE